MLLCSDGLTGPVDDDDIADILEAVDDPDATPSASPTCPRLVDAANDAGGPDNVTVVVLAFEELPTAPAPRTAGRPGWWSAAATRRLGDGDWASRLGRLGDLGGGPRRRPTRRRPATARA